MSDQFVGFCPSCMKNIVHVCRIHNRALRLLDLVSMKAIRIFRFGYWHCIQCGNTTYRLGRIRRDAPDFQADDLSENADKSEVGNFLKTERSLLLRAKRAHRYSQKYRDGVVYRLLNGSATVTQLKRELDLSEIDLMDWVADLFQRKQDQILELERMLQQVSEKGNLLELFPSPVSYATDDALDAEPPPR